MRFKMAFGRHLLICLFFLATLGYLGHCAPSKRQRQRQQGGNSDGASGEEGMWQPSSGFGPSDRDTFLKNHGMNDADFEMVKEAMVDVKRMIAQEHDREVTDEDVEEMDEKLGDILLTREQAEQLRQQLSTHRKKRKAINFQLYTTSKWPAGPIYYKIDGAHDADGEAVITAAIDHWETRTCLRFTRVDVSADITVPHILFTAENNGCYSYVGRVTSVIPQQINLQSTGCLSVLGIAVHEIGHAIGFYHEHVRPDRDDYVTILEANIRTSALSNFEIQSEINIDTNGVPYDYASVMHYATRDFSVDSSTLDTIRTSDPLYQNTIGQRTGLSYYDIHLANVVYCSEVCGDLECVNGGHVDPNDCTVCKCPDGFGGTLCEEVANSDASCPSPGVISVSSDQEQCFTMPAYEDLTSCNWLLQAEDGCTIDMYFKDDFGVYCSGDDSCYHWVELKYGSDISMRGPRFCCYDTPDLGSNGLTSATNEAVVTFRSDQEVNGTPSGFTFCYKLSDSTCLATTAESITEAVTTAAAEEKVTTETATTAEEEITTEAAATTEEKTTSMPTTTTSTTTTQTTTAATEAETTSKPTTTAGTTPSQTTATTTTTAATSKTTTESGSSSEYESSESKSDSGSHGGDSSGGRGKRPKRPKWTNSGSQESHESPESQEFPETSEYSESSESQDFPESPESHESPESMTSESPESPEPRRRKGRWRAWW